MKKTKLASEFAFDLTVIGLMCALPEYKLAWYVNGFTKAHLIKQEDLKVDLKRNAELLISNLLYETDHITVRLLNNRLVGEALSGRVYLVNDLDQFQYIITVDDKYDTFDLQNFLDELRSVDPIQYVTIIDITKLKDKENLIL
ncbi:MAG: IPExxxVDY family protein [Bacteroidota bacterium]